jgi:hypothetical protein
VEKVIANRARGAVGRRVVAQILELAVDALEGHCCSCAFQKCIKEKDRAKKKPVERFSKKEWE